MWVGSLSADALGGWVPAISLVFTAYWFGYFLVILPLLGVIEKPLPQPATIEEDFNAHYGNPGGTGSAVAQPAE
jgi:ubiquinol-cytochrome c reductase cytochrome b subunit